MADNVTANPGSGGSTFASDDIGGVQFPRVKITVGGDGTNDGDVASGNPLPVSGAVTVSGVATAANQTTIIGYVDGIETAMTAANSSLDAIEASTAAMDTDLTTVIGHLDGVEALLGTIDADTGSILTAVQLIDNTIVADDAVFTPGTTSVSMAGFEADEGSTDSVDEGDAGAARMTLDRKQIVTQQPHTAGGLSIFRSLDLDEGTLEVVKNAPGQVYSYIITNFATAVRFIKFYDSTSGTAGTGTPAFTVPVPGNASDDTTLVQNFGGLGIAFGTGICVGATTGLADNDTGAPGAADVAITVFYK